MELHFWLIPLLLVTVALLTIFYLVVKYTGGTGVRTQGRTVVDKPAHEESTTHPHGVINQ
jgi:hypothetical protein